MQMDNLEPDLIERQLQRDRAALKASLSALGDRFALPIGGDLLAQAQKCANVARAHPALVSLAGAGLAWYLLRRNGTNSGAPSDPSSLSGTTFEAKARWEDEGGPPMEEDDDFDWIAEAEALRARANISLQKLEKMALNSFDYAKQRAAVLADLARDVRKAMRGGLDQLSTAAQDRILAGSRSLRDSS